MDRVIIGMDPHKRSVTIEVLAPDETVFDGGRYATDRAGYAAMLRDAQRWPERVWAVEGCSGIGRHVAARLLADGEVVDVPPKLSARVRVFSTGHGRKTDATDAHSVALVGTRMAGLRPVVDDQQLAVLRVLADRRRALGEDTPGWSRSRATCCWSSSRAGRRRICRLRRRRRCWRRSGRATPPARPGAGSPPSSSPTSSGSTRARRPPTRSCASSSRRPAPRC
ncbi:MAG: IS110 family transposase [Actinomycetota bacterium]|nr:IS110 family transposase [Actinomycetota bacterium]